MKLNIGCGFRKKEGFVNIDSDPGCAPDVLCDLEGKWPFDDNSVDVIVADHVLEHLGGTTATWMNLWKEIWRVCRHDALIEIKVPHPRHDNFICDPTHVRPIMPTTIAMFDQDRNIANLQSGGQETKLGLMNGIDLCVTTVGYDLNEPWKSGAMQGTISNEEIQRDLTLLNNVCSQIVMEVRIVKPCRSDSRPDFQDILSQARQRSIVVDP